MSPLTSVPKRSTNSALSGVAVTLGLSPLDTIARPTRGWRTNSHTYRPHMFDLKQP